MGCGEAGKAGRTHLSSFVSFRGNQVTGAHTALKVSTQKVACREDVESFRWDVKCGGSEQKHEGMNTGSLRISVRTENSRCVRGNVNEFVDVISVDFTLSTSHSPSLLGRELSEFRDLQNGRSSFSSSSVLMDLRPTCGYM